jgi:hypothetical protein
VITPENYTLHGIKLSTVPFKKAQLVPVCDIFGFCHYLARLHIRLPAKSVAALEIKGG